MGKENAPLEVAQKTEFAPLWLPPSLVIGGTNEKVVQLDPSGSFVIINLFGLIKMKIIPLLVMEQ